MQITAASTVKDLALVPDPTSIAISPATIYHLELPPAAQLEGKNADNDDGELFSRLHWNGFGDADGACNFSLVCPTLEGNPCGSYGITITYSSGLVDQEPVVQAVCHAGRYYVGQLEPTHTATIEVWQHEEAADVSAHCYMWCSESGEAPTRPVSAEAVVTAVETNAVVE